MASSNSNNSDELHNVQENVQVKIEPGTSGTIIPLSERISKIKVEPGLPSTTQRLTSFRLPRDLTLGGNIKLEKPKKVYTPNINVQRNKNETSVKIEPKTSSNHNRGQTRGRDRGRGGRGSRGRGRGNIIESDGVWSKGIHTSPSIGRKSDSYPDSSDRKYLQKPKLNLKVDKTEEQKIHMMNLLKNNYVDDDADYDRKEPLLLYPRKKNAHKYEEIDIKPVISENDGVINVKKETSSKEDMMKPCTISEILNNRTNCYTLIQLPNHLPGLTFNQNKEKPGPSGSNTNSNDDDDNKEKAHPDNLKSLKNGLLGKLEILKSGKARLRLGEIYLHVDVGTEQNVHQDLLAAKVNTLSSTGDLINLGQVNSKLICSPDVRSMLKNMKSSKARRY